MIAAALSGDSAALFDADVEQGDAAVAPAAVSDAILVVSEWITTEDAAFVFRKHANKHWHVTFAVQWVKLCRTARLANCSLLPFVRSQQGSAISKPETCHYVARKLCQMSPSHSPA